MLQFCVKFIKLQCKNNIFIHFRNNFNKTFVLSFLCVDDILYSIKFLRNYWHQKTRKVTKLAKIKFSFSPCCLMKMMFQCCTHFRSFRMLFWAPTFVVNYNKCYCNLKVNLANNKNYKNSSIAVKEIFQCCLSNTYILLSNVWDAIRYKYFDLIASLDSIISAHFDCYHICTNTI